MWELDAGAVHGSEYTTSFDYVKTMLVYIRDQTKEISTRAEILIQWIGSRELLQNSHHFSRC